MSLLRYNKGLKWKWEILHSGKNFQAAESDNNGIMERPGLG